MVGYTALAILIGAIGGVAGASLSLLLFYLSSEPGEWRNLRDRELPLMLILFTIPATIIGATNGGIVGLIAAVVGGGTHIGLEWGLIAGAGTAAGLGMQHNDRSIAIYGALVGGLAGSLVGLVLGRGSGFGYGALIGCSLALLLSFYLVPWVTLLITSWLDAI